MHPGNASRSLRRGPSNFPPSPGFMAPRATPFLILLEHKTLLLRIRQRLLCATGRWHIDHISDFHSHIPGVRSLNNPAQGPICASRHKKAHWRRRCDQSHSQTDLAGPMYPDETPNNKWVGPLFRRSVGGRCDATNSGPFLICSDRRSVCCWWGGLIFPWPTGRA
jgi:hypothetical protein